jgi:flagellar basal-body rod protein FlgB
MPDHVTFNNAIHALQQAVRIARRRHSVIAGNIGNVDTPGYRNRNIDFHEAFQGAMDRTGSVGLKRTHPRHLPSNGAQAPGVAAEEDAGEWNGLNNVNLDKEIGKLAENNLIYRSGIEMMLRRIATLKEVIHEGGK